MHVFCAWCIGYMGTKEPLSDTTVTHGICPKCFKTEIEKINREAARKKMKESLDIIPGLEPAGEEWHQ